MYTNAKRGLYKVINKIKVIKPIDNHMQSFIIEDEDIFLEYKSSLELKAIRYADCNKHIIKFALEPFAIKYLSPKDGKIHRYYIDMFLEFSTGDKILVEIKPKSQTVPPKKPKKDTEKTRLRYQSDLMTYAVNSAKWKAAREFAAKNKMTFTILTDEILN